jgi:serine/threonine protein kinase
MQPVASASAVRKSLVVRQVVRQAVARPAVFCDPWRLTRRLRSEGRLTLFRAAAAGDRGPGCYVLKALYRNHTREEAASALLRREAAVAADVNHVNLVSVVVARLRGTHPYLVLPYLDGITLRRAQQPRSSVAFALSLVRQVATAIETLHGAGWLHGQVRPEHVIVSPQGHATLIDLTHARRLDSGECETDGGLPFVPAYAVPESMARGGRLNPAADIYALGMLLYEIIAGRPPFVARSPREWMRCHQSEAPADLRQFRVDVPPEVDELVRRMLAKEPLRRPSAKQVVRWLAELEIEELANR